MVIGSENAYRGLMGCYTLRSVVLVPAIWRNALRVACLRILITGSYKNHTATDSNMSRTCSMHGRKEVCTVQFVNLMGNLGSVDAWGRKILALKKFGPRLACLHLCCEYGNELSDPISTVNLLISAVTLTFSKDSGAALFSRLYCCYSSTYQVLFFCRRPSGMFIDEYGSGHWGFLVS